MAATTQTKVMLVDDHDIMRDGLREVLEHAGDFEIVGEAADGEAAVRIASDVRPEVIIMDVMMPVKNGIEACREITETQPESRVLILTASPEEDAIVEAVAAGAAGYLQKYSGKEQLLQTVRDVANGEYRIPADAVRRAFSGIREASGQIESQGSRKLTARDKEILTLFSQGLSYAEIAEVRGNKRLTIRNAIYGIQDKLAIDTKQELVVWAVQNGLLDGFKAGAQGSL